MFGGVPWRVFRGKTPRRMGNLYQRLGSEERALHDSWDSVARVMIIVTMMSVAVWGVCSALRWACHLMGDTLLHGIEEHPENAWAWGGLAAALALGAIIRATLSKRAKWNDVEGDGLDIALRNYHITYEHEGDDPQPRFDLPAITLAIRKAIATALTVGTGASGGLEGPVVLIGESVGAGAARIFRARSEHELRTYQLAGIAAAVSTLLSAPFTAALFAIEIAYGDRIIYRKFAYALLAGTVAFLLNRRFLGLEPLLVAPPHVRGYSLAEYAMTAMVAVTVSAPVALGFGRMMADTGRLVARVNPTFRGLFGAVAMAAVALAVWAGVDMLPHHVLGMGEHTLAQLLAPNAHFPWYFLLIAIVGKMVTTGLTMRTGGSAGLLVPSMFLGGVSGALTAELLVQSGIAPGLDLASFVVVGIASALVAVVGVPLAAIALVLEVFGSAYGPPAILACGMTYVLTLRLRIYGHQRMSPDPDADEVGHA